MFRWTAPKCRGFIESGTKRCGVKSVGKRKIYGYLAVPFCQYHCDLYDEAMSGKAAS